MSPSSTELAQPVLQPPVLHTHDARGVHTLTLNRASTFNALGEDVLAALQAALDAVALDQAQLTHLVLAVRIESGADENHFGLELF